MMKLSALLLSTIRVVLSLAVSGIGQFDNLMFIMLFLIAFLLKMFTRHNLLALLISVILVMFVNYYEHFMILDSLLGPGILI